MRAYNRSFEFPPFKESGLDSAELARTIFNALSEKQAEDIVILDLRPVSLLADYFVIATAGSSRQLRVLVEAATDAAREEASVKPIGVEGGADSGWALVDFSDVVVHIFDAPRRDFYSLEDAWREAPLVARMP
jgi:ribosome-associated protein